VVWFDAHGDCNTPETFTGNFLDAMGLSTLTGRCWQALAATVPGFRPVMDERVLLIGAHGIDDGARRVLAESRIANVRTGAILANGIKATLLPALDALAEAGISRVYVHFDVDVLDARYAAGNEFASEGGLLPVHVLDSLDSIAARITIAAAGVASYDPAYDYDGRVLEAALRYLELITRQYKCGFESG
jgi:arginase